MRAGLFEDFYENTFGARPRFEGQTLEAKIDRLMRFSYEAGYNQHKAEEEENGRLLKGILDGIRIDP